jgi:hypothetical protein
MHPTHHPVYGLWLAMKRRCDLPSVESFPRYGGRGIRVCDRWVKSFPDFLADMGERPEGQCIERIDNDGDYEPGNCRWATMAEQCRNRRSNVHVTTWGETRILQDWISDPRCVVGYITLYQRIKKGVAPEIAMTQIPRPNWKSINKKKEMAHAHV